MVITENDNKLAFDLKNRILEKLDIDEIEGLLEKTKKDIPEQNRIVFWKHLSALLENTLLNELGYYGRIGKEKAHKARKIIKKYYLEELDKKS